jgi:hypothetical protein
MRRFSTATLISLAVIGAPLDAQTRPGPEEWLRSFLENPRGRYSVAGAFSPCPANDPANEAIVAALLSADLPKERLTDAARGFTAGLSVCGDERALTWLLATIERTVDTDPDIAASILGYLRTSQHVSPAYSAGVARLLRRAPAHRELARNAVGEALRVVDDATITELFIAAYPAGLHREAARSLFVGILNRRGDAFLRDVVTMVHARPEIVKDEVFVLSARGYAKGPDGQVGQGGQELVRVVEEARRRLVDTLPERYRLNVIGQSPLPTFSSTMTHLGTEGGGHREVIVLDSAFLTFEPAADGAVAFRLEVFHRSLRFNLQGVTGAQGYGDGTFGAPVVTISHVGRVTTNGSDLAFTSCDRPCALIELVRGTQGIPGRFLETEGFLFSPPEPNRRPSSAKLSWKREHWNPSLDGMTPGRTELGGSR